MSNSDSGYQQTIVAIKDLLGSKGWRESGNAAAYYTDPRGRFTGRGNLVALPENTSEVSQVVSICHHNKTPVIPYSGGTGVVAGQLSLHSDEVLILSLERMDEVRHISAEDGTMLAEAGCILSNVHDAAAEQGMLFPLSMASKGSCRIGGNLATNAGGIQVLRYGNARDLCIGIEAVLPDGSILNELSPLRKNNTGYDLRHLLIGSEGTLGIITAACLNLKPANAETVTAFCAIQSPTQAVGLLQSIRSQIGESVSAIELMSSLGMELLQEHFPNINQPFEQKHEWYVLIEVAGQSGIRQNFESALFEAMEEDVVTDAVIAATETQRNALWDLRENMPEANRLSGAICNSDTSVPISQIDVFNQQTAEAVSSIHSGLRLNSYGHIGDGNIHHNVFPPLGISKSEFVKAHPEKIEAVRMAINEVTHQCSGAISAEHGIGRLKVGDMKQYADPVKMQVMRSIKQALDPNGIMNPGVILSA